MKNLEHSFDITYTARISDCFYKCLLFSCLIFRHHIAIHRMEHGVEDIILMPSNILDID